MNREEALIDYREKIANKLCEQAMIEFRDIFLENEDEIKVLVITTLKKLIKKWNNNRDEELTIIQYELLRTSVLDENYIFYVHGYDNSWYEDENSIIYEVDFKFLFEPFIKLKENLIKEKKIYLGRVNNYDIQEIIFEKVVEAFKRISDIIRCYLWDIDEDSWIKENLKSSKYYISWNEYQDENIVVFAMDYSKKNNEDMKLINKKDKEDNAFVYSVWIDSNFNELDLSKNNMHYVNFKGSIFKNINFKECNMIRAQLKNCTFINCDFTNTNLTSASFENVILEDCTFKNALMIATNFSGANLRKIDFENADMRGTFFSSAEFSNVDFINANVDSAIFDIDKVPYLHLTSEQLQTIYIEGDEKK